MLKKGLVQIYTGDGKGKTTAAFGQALRAAGAGNKVLIYQFLKPASLKTAERSALEQGAIAIKIDSLDMPWDMAKSFKDDKALTQMRRAIAEVLEKLAESAEKKEYDVLILDEIVFCISSGLAKLEDVKQMIDRRDKRVEIVMTGRGASEELIVMADLVTEMKKIKHPFDKGITAREGIEY